MTRINDLSLLTGSTATNSAFIWTIWEGKDYKVALADLGLFIGRNAGTCLTTAGGTDVNLTSGQIISWNTTFWDDLGWWNASSVGILEVKDDKVTHVNMKIQYYFYGTSQRGLLLHVNGTAATSATVRMNRNMAGSYPIQGSFISNRFPVSSGDILDIRCNNGTSTNTLQATHVCHWQVTPAEYK